MPKILQTQMDRHIRLQLQTIIRQHQTSAPMPIHRDQQIIYTHLQVRDSSHTYPITLSFLRGTEPGKFYPHWKNELCGS